MKKHPLFGNLKGNKKYSLENRLLISSLLAGLAISLIGSIVSIILSSSIIVILTAVSLFFLQIIVYYLILTDKKFEYLVFPLIIAAIFGISIIWIFDGGINSSNLFPGFIVLILSLIIVPPNKEKYVLFIYIFSVVIIYLIQLYKPELIVDFPSEKARWLDSIITVIYSSILASWIINFLHRNYTTEKNNAENYALELKELIKTKDKLYSIISHDLRSPFNNIIGLSELLNDERNSSEETKKYSALLNSTANNALIMFDNLLNWTKSHSEQFVLKLRNVKLSTIINDVIDTSKSIAQIKNIELIVNQSEDISAYTDANIVTIILRNLISNAIKFTEVGGQIVLKVIPNKKSVEITIDDNGIGMGEEKIQTLFDITSNTTSDGTAKEKGTGLGLVLCKELVQKLGGDIWVKSEIGVGSSFTFTLPLNTTP
jgi:signal transduction histidine kinase